MKHLRKLLALLLALACCLALLPVSAMAETYYYSKKGNQPWCFDTIVVSMASMRYLSCDGNPMRFGGVMGGGAHSEYDVKYADRKAGTFQIRIMTSFLDTLSTGTHTFTVTDGPDKGRTFDIVVKMGTRLEDLPPATPTDLSGGSDEPDEVLYIGAMSGAGAAATKGGKPADIAAAAALPAAQAQQAVILPENAPVANPATGAAI